MFLLCLCGKKHTYRQGQKSFRQGSRNADIHYAYAAAHITARTT